MATVNLKLKSITVKADFNILAFRHYCDAKGIELEQLGEHMVKAGMFGITDMIYYGHIAYCDINDKEPLINHSQSTMWLEDADEKALKLVEEAIMDVKLLGKKLRDQAGAAAQKKKAAGRGKASMKGV